MLTDVDGVRVGHWTAPDRSTGCTVVRLPEGTVASAEFRGGAPATRDAVLLGPDKTVARLDAVLLSGRSVFGLAAVDGVLEVLAGEGVGLETPGGPVPIVVGLGLFDLTSGDPAVRPGPRGRRRRHPGRHRRDLRGRAGRRRRRCHGRQVAGPGAQPPGWPRHRHGPGRGRHGRRPGRGQRRGLDRRRDPRAGHAAAAGRGRRVGRHHRVRQHHDSAWWSPTPTSTRPPATSSPGPGTAACPGP